eukprot:TRINITY_DN106579_c0_g1_i1.p1 TRINITY_DN106579_c0_g1~~TRINITY_DN106579_c0_g1_i1.p1  ORF type:complete len:500 (+),score=136.82 TRINITY_DN106579_c0_g1_i1:30-1502(+)
MFITPLSRPHSGVVGFSISAPVSPLNFAQPDGLQGCFPGSRGESRGMFRQVSQNMLAGGAQGPPWPREMLSAPQSPMNTHHRRELFREAVKPKKEASMELSNAMLSDSSSELQAAISEARKSGVKRTKVDKALIALQKLEATEACKRATEAKDVEILRKEVMKARRLEIPERDLNAAQQCLEVLEAEEMLRISMRNGVTGHLKKCIDIAVYKGAPENLINEAKALYALSGAERHLASAMRHPDLDKLNTAVGEAQEAGVDKEWVEDAQALRDELKKKEEKPETDNKDGPKDEHEDRLRTAIRLMETGALTKAIFLAKRADEAFKQHPELGSMLHDKSIAEAERLLGEKEVFLHLPNYIRKQDKKKLKETLEKADKQGLEGELIDHGKLVLKQIEALELLNKAISQRDEQKLIEALEPAHACGVDRGRILKAEQTLAHIQARSRLKAAIESKDIQQLADAIEQGAHSLQRKEIMDAETMLKSWERRGIRPG